MRAPAIQVIFCALISMVFGINNETYFKPTPLFPALPIEVYSLDNGLCSNHSEILKVSLKNNSLWAYKMWEATAKDPFGTIVGNMYHLGHFDECLSVQMPIRATYCLVNLKIIYNKNYTILDPFSLNYDPFESIYENIQYNKDPNKIRRDTMHMGICIPKSCTADDIQISMENYLKQKYNNSDRNYEISIADGDCYKKENYIFDAKDLSFCVLVAILILVVGICTYIDYYYENKTENPKSKTLKLFLCFSIRENINDFKKIENNSLNAMYTARILMMSGIIFGHSIVNTLTGPIYNYENIEKVNRGFMAMFICRGEIIVDVFFLFSGILVTYTYMVQSEKTFINPLRAIILRYFRLMPMFAFLTFFYATIYYKLGTGPMWNKLVGAERHYCQTNWWTNLLLINNYVNVKDLCILPAWYLPCDFHFFILAIPLNALIRKNQKIGLSVLGILLVSSLLPIFLHTYIGNMAPFYYIFNDYFFTVRQNEVFQSVYITSHTRAAPYIIGMFNGYLYYKLKSTKFQISTIYSHILSCATTIVALSCILGGIVFFNPYKPYNVLEGAMYATFHRPFYALAGATGLLLSCYGSIPIWTNILTWRPILPFGKLTFGAYLASMIFQTARAGHARSPENIDLYSWIADTMIDIFYSMGTAFVLFLLVENPFSRLAKELLPNNASRKNTAVSTEILFSTNI